jgi:hypothetical protein
MNVLGIALRNCTADPFQRSIETFGEGLTFQAMSVVGRVAVHCVKRSCDSRCADVQSPRGAAVSIACARVVSEVQLVVGAGDVAAQVKKRTSSAYAVAVRIFKTILPIKSACLWACFRSDVKSM